MKEIYSILAGLLLIVTISWPLQSNAQAPQTMAYKLVLRESKNSSLTNLQIGIKMIILQSSDDGKAGYFET
jgi:subtilase family serine protease